MTLSPPTEQAKPTHRGTWRALVAGWRWFVPIVVGNAVVQGLLIIGDPLIEATPGFVLRVLASALVLIVAVALVACVAVAAVSGHSCPGPESPAVLAKVVGWAAGVAVVTAAASVVAPWLGPLGCLLGTVVLVSVADGGSPVQGFAIIKRAPVRCVLALLAYVMLVALSWVGALLLGFFVTGVVAAMVLWLWLGLLATVVVCGCAALRRRLS